MPNNWFVIGKIVNTHGIRGEVKVLGKTDFPDVRFAKGSEMRIVPETTAVPAVEVSVETARKHQNFYIIKFNEYDNINMVEKYKGAALKVPESQLIKLPENEYYFYEIVGCRVIAEDGAELGAVAEILTPGANDVWVVRRPDGKELLIPVIDDVVLHVDVGQKTITVRLLEGLV